MKTLILSEGKNDRKFIKGLYVRHKIHEDKIRFFDQKERDILKELERAESKYLRSFFEDSSPFEILVKSEGGKSKVITVFSKFMSYLFNYSKGLKIIILIDLDERPLNQFIYKLKNKIQNKGKGRMLGVEHNILREDKYLKTSKISIVIREDSYTLGTFLLMAFNLSLEKEAGVVKSDTPDERDTKILELLDNREILSSFSSIFKTVER